MPTRLLPSRRAAAVGAVVLLLLVAWLSFRALQIRSSLGSARATLAGLAGSLDATDAGEVRAAARAASEDVEAARSAADDPVWRLAAAVPLLGNSFELVRRVTGATGQVLEDVVPPAEEAATLLSERPLLREGQVDLALLTSLAQAVSRAAEAAAAADVKVRDLPDRLVPGSLQERGGEVQRQIRRLNQTLRSADTALELAPAMLGSAGPRRYFLAVQNNAEARGTGGLVGAYAVLGADRGRLTRERVGTDDDFRTARSPVVDLGPDFNQHYDSDGGRVYWSSAVLTPDWPSAAEIMAGLWRAQGGGRIDGVIGVDPVSMAEILRATGPARVAGREIGADNVVDFVMRDEYALFENRSAARKRALSQLAAGIYDRVVSGSASSQSLLAAVASGTRRGHVQLWSAVPAEQAVLQPLRVGGALPGVPGSYLSVITNNGAGNKADYYIRRKVSYSRDGESGRLRVVLTNGVDARAVPPIVIGRLDEPEYAVDPGQTKLLTSIYVGVGQRVRTVTVDGKPVPFAPGREKGHGRAFLPVEVSPLRPTVIEAVVDDPGGVLRYHQQPLVVDDALDLAVPHIVR